MMYKHYDLPFAVEHDGLSIAMTKGRDATWQYARTCREDGGVPATVEKTIVASKGDVLIQPVEPLNTPKALTPYLLIEFEHALLLEPRGTKRLFVTFPIEIGVLIRLNKDVKLVDCVSLNAQKFTLYGDPNHGVICKYWRTPVYDTPPAPDPLRAGVLELLLSSSGREWEEISKVVLNAYGMKLYYHDTLVTLKGKMKIGDDKAAETEMHDTGLERGMKKAPETFAARKLAMMTTTTFRMEHGV